ncbi:MAG: MerR family transcriptional regulator [Lutibacter sp.]|jgi:DNA-binding transcriptional MerR regulator
MKDIENLKQKLLVPIFKKNDFTISYRTLNHYDVTGILISERTNPNQWRKFSSFEFIWVELVMELREIGMPLSKILILKNKLFEEGKKGSVDKANFINKSFEEEITLSIINNYDLYMLIFNDCNYTFHDSQSLQQWHNGVYKNEPHINIPLSNIIQEAINKLNNQ